MGPRHFDTPGFNICFEYFATVAPGGFFNLNENDVGCQLTLEIKKVTLSVLIASKINSFKMLPVYMMLRFERS